MISYVLPQLGLRVENLRFQTGRWRGRRTPVIIRSIFSCKTLIQGIKEVFLVTKKQSVDIEAYI